MRMGSSCWRSYPTLRLQHPRQDSLLQRGESRMAGLGRMIERMAGHGTTSDKPSASSIADRVSERLSARRQGNLDTEFDDLADDSQAGNAEIPAFLRRQAN